MDDRKEPWGVFVQALYAWLAARHAPLSLLSAKYEKVSVALCAGDGTMIGLRSRIIDKIITIIPIERDSTHVRLVDWTTGWFFAEENGERGYDLPLKNVSKVSLGVCLLQYGGSNIRLITMRQLAGTQLLDLMHKADPNSDFVLLPYGNLPALGSDLSLSSIMIAMLFAAHAYKFGPGPTAEFLMDTRIPE